MVQLSSYVQLKRALQQLAEIVKLYLICHLTDAGAIATRLSRANQPGTRLLVGKLASHFALAPMSQANSVAWPVPYACAQPYNAGSGHSRPQSPSFLGQIRPSGSGNEKGKWRPWRESCFALITTHQHGPLNTALILQGSEGYVILMSLNEMRKSCPWLPLLS